MTTDKESNCAVELIDYNSKTWWWMDNYYRFISNYSSSTRSSKYNLEMSVEEGLGCQLLLI